MENLSDLRAALVDFANDSQTRVLSRRGLLAGASFLGAMALASAAPAQAEITSQAVYAKAGPYGGNTLPDGVRVRPVPNVNGLTVNLIRRHAGPASRAVAARFSNLVIAGAR